MIQIKVMQKYKPRAIAENDEVEDYIILVHFTSLQ
jgi:hypothetical protein